MAKWSADEDRRHVVPPQLPLLPIRNRVLLPGSLLRLNIGRPKSVQLVTGALLVPSTQKLRKDALIVVATVPQSKKGKAKLDTPCGDKHEWKQWTDYVKHCKKFRCEREGCGYFKKCWTACENIDCKGCHVPAHKRW